MKGYQLKVFSILLSSFREVLWLDSDNVPAMNPAEAFQLKPYKETGGVSLHYFMPSLSEGTSLSGFSYQKLTKPLHNSIIFD
jgi:hypothetical protein